jgi:hypothetical protein
MMFLCSVCLLLALVGCVASQSLETVLATQSGLSTFTSFITQFPDLVTQLDGGSYTRMTRTQYLHLRPADDE